MADNYKESAPPIEQYGYQQGPPGMPAAPPSYEQSMQPPNYVGAPGGSQMYPPLPDKGAPPPAAPAVPVVIQEVRYVQAPSYGPRPQNMVCPHCQSSITTSTESEASAWAWIIGAALCFVGLWPCACIPCCMDSLQQVKHKCPNCKNFLGMYKGGL